MRDTVLRILEIEKELSLRGAAEKTVEYHAGKIREICEKLGWQNDGCSRYSALIDSAANQKTLSSVKSVSELFAENGILVNPNVNKEICFREFPR